MADKQRLKCFGDANMKDSGLNSILTMKVRKR